MSVVEDLARWIGEQLDAEERIARAAADYDDGATHDVQGPPGTWTCLDESEWFGPSYRGGVIAPRIGTVNAPALGAHIAAHDPARVLREIDAKREMVAEHGIRDGRCRVCAAHAHGNWTRFRAPCRTLRLLALPYDQRPGYLDAWRP